MPSRVIAGHLTTKSDVYSFGVVLLELLTGRRSVDKTKPKSEEKLVDWARPYIMSSRKLRFIMDQRLEGRYSIKGAKVAATLALQCISPKPKDRPWMAAAVEIQEGLQHFKDMAVSCEAWPFTPMAGRRVIAARAKMEVKRGGRRQPVASSAKLK